MRSQSNESVNKVMNLMLSFTTERPARSYAVHFTLYKYLPNRLKVATETDTLNFIFKHTIQPGLVENAHQLLCKGPDTLNLCIIKHEEDIGFLPQDIQQLCLFSDFFTDRKSGTMPFF